MRHSGRPHDADDAACDCMRTLSEREAHCDRRNPSQAVRDERTATILADAHCRDEEAEARDVLAEGRDVAASLDSFLRDVPLTGTTRDIRPGALALSTGETRKMIGPLLQMTENSWPQRRPTLS